MACGPMAGELGRHLGGTSRRYARESLRFGGPKPILQEEAQADSLLSSCQLREKPCSACLAGGTNFLAAIVLVVLQVLYMLCEAQSLSALLRGRQ